MPSRAIYGCAGTALSAAERDFFRASRPWGFILFGRNIDSPAQVKALVDDLRVTVGNARAPVLIDQEGGRVARLKPPTGASARRRHVSARSMPTIPKPPRGGLSECPADRP